MSNDYTDAFEDQVNGAELAFDRADAYFFQDQQLEPFSGRRRRIAERLGLQFFDVLKDDATAKAFAETKSYPAFDDDMVLVLWLCSVNKERCGRARQFPARALEEADDWADEKGIFPGGHGQAEACEVFTSIMVDILNSVAQAAGADLEGEDEGAPGKSQPTGASTNSHSQKRRGSASSTPDGISHLHKDTSIFPATLKETA